ncbi:MFS transporter [bacterium]|nr:MFS transporter [bacterium]
MIKIKRPVVGWILYDFANSAFATIVLAVIFNRYYAEVVAGGQAGTMISLPWGKYSIPGSVMWSFLVAFSTAIVAITSPLLGAMADRGYLRKKLLVVYCYIGVTATIALSFIGRGDVFIGGFIFVIANLGFAGGNVFYNSFLLDVSRRETFGSISGIAWGLGYLGGGLCLVISLIMLKKPQLLGFPEGHFTVSHCIVLAGIWWGVFALPTVLWIKERTKMSKEIITLSKLTSEGFNRLIRTFKKIRRYKQLVRFLVAFLIFNDGVETVIIMAAIFGAEVVKMDAGDLIMFFIMVQATAIVGSIFFGWLSDIIGNKKTLLINIVIWLGIVIWAYFLGWISDYRTEFYLLGVITGIVMGGIQACSRALQASFTPDGHSAEFFGFWAISGRFASIFGPFFYGLAILISGGVKSGILVLGIFFVVGGLLLVRVNEDEGIRAAVVSDNNIRV